MIVVIIIIICLHANQFQLHGLTSYDLSSLVILLPNQLTIILIQQLLDC